MAGETAFVGDVPRIYDTHMGPLFFQCFARDLAVRLARRAPRSVLTLACGTGIDARAAKNALPNAEIVATDLNIDMLKIAEEKFAPGEVRLEVADAQSLPFPDASFDAVTCQFGLMFVPDKDAALREVRRVLTPDGVFLCSVWDAIQFNNVSEAVHQLILETCKTNPPMFWLTPFGFHDQKEIRSLFERNGFKDVTVEVLALDIEVPDVAKLAHGLVYGTPAYGQLSVHPDVNLAVLEQELFARLREVIGPTGKTRRQAIVVEGRKS